MKVGKPKSKRVPVRLRNKIQKSSANKLRKGRKEAKKNPQWQSRLKKDPGIPNLFPYKDKVLAEIEESKRKKEEEKERRKEVARAQREGKAVELEGGVAAEDAEGDEEMDDDVESDGDEEMDTGESKHPMAALLASAQARAHTHLKDDGEDEEEDNEEDEGLTGFANKNTKTAPGKASGAVAKKFLPKQVFDDPIKPVTRLLDQLQKTQDGISQLLEFYQLPPLVTAGSDTTTRFLVDVARKRGRLGRGGIPNLNAAALTVLGDLNEDRLKLPALQQQKRSEAVANGEVQIVKQMAQPFRIEGLWGNAAPTTTGEMDIEA